MSRGRGPVNAGRWRLLKRSRILARATMPDFIEKDGEAFFQTGRSIVDTLREFAAALRQSRWQDVEQFYSSGFLGRTLGINLHTLQSQKDGIHVYSFESQTPLVERAAAISEWHGYLQAFDEVEELSLHLHRLESWREPDLKVASVRFECIGRPIGFNRSCIDRAYLRMAWERAD